jgi:Kef-type K+ transport system membrane component KefB
MTQISKARITLLTVEAVAFAVFYVSLRWALPHSGTWSGLVFVAAFLVISSLIIQSQIMRRRIQKAQQNGAGTDVR